MKQAVRDVADFHRTCGVPILQSPHFPEDDRIEFRINIMDEEFNKELIPAIRRYDMIATADGIADSIYVLVGTALEFGIPLAWVWDAVHAANMAKVDPVTGLVRRRADGKILKPDGWLPPNIEKVLYG